MSTMRAVQVVGYHQNLEMTEVPAPTPTGPFDVIVKIGGAGVCRTDLHILEGQWAEKNPDLQLPYTIGHENAGWVHAVGSAVTNVAEGDKVIVHPLITCGLCRACRSGNDVHCEASAFPGIDTNGGYAEYLKTSARSVVKIDDSLEPSDIAALADAGLTAYHAAAKAARRLTPRDRCVVIGAGGLGHIGIQVLKALSPAELIVVDRNPDALKLAEAIGADHGVIADGTQVEHVLDLTGGHGAEAVVDFVGEGGATGGGSRDAAPRGRLPRRRLRREHRRADHRHRLHRDQLHRQPRRVLQRPVRPDGAGRPRCGEPAHPEVRTRRLPVRHHRSRQRQRPWPSDSDSLVTEG